MWGVTAGKAIHNTSNARAVTAGKVRRNSSTFNSSLVQRLSSDQSFYVDPYTVRLGHCKPYTQGAPHESSQVWSNLLWLSDIAVPAKWQHNEWN